LVSIVTLWCCRPPPHAEAQRRRRGGSRWGYEPVGRRAPSPRRSAAEAKGRIKVRRLPASDSAVGRSGGGGFNGASQPSSRWERHAGTRTFARSRKRVRTPRRRLPHCCVRDLPTAPPAILAHARMPTSPSLRCARVGRGLKNKRTVTVAVEAVLVRNR